MHAADGIYGFTSSSGALPIDLSLNERASGKTKYALSIEKTEHPDLKSELSSRERLLGAINLEEPDRIPLLLRFFGRQYLVERGRPWNDQFDRVDQLLRLGLDDAVGISPQLSHREGVRIRRWKETETGERYPLIVKEYETAGGTLRQVARQTPDWPQGDDVHLFDDYNVPPARTRKYPVDNAADLDALTCLFGEPTGEELDDFKTYAGKVEDFSNSREVLVEGEGPMLGDAAVWLCGIEKVVLSEVKDPRFLNRLLEIIHGWDMLRIRMLLEAGVDIVFHRGWYESAMFWSPSAYCKFLAPLIREEVEAVHRAGVKFGYIATRDITPLLGIISEMGVDLLFGPDPVEGNCDLRRVKEEVGEDVCLWGGVNSAVTLEQGSKGQIWDAVSEAVRILAPGGGFILGLVDAVFGRTAGTIETPPNSLGYVIECWRRMRDNVRQ